MSMSLYMFSMPSSPQLNLIRLSLMPSSALLAGPWSQYEMTVGCSIRVSHPPRLGAMYGILTASTKREVASRSPSTCTIDWWLCKRGGNVRFDLRDDKPAAARGTLRTFY